MILPISFYLNDDVVQVARDLLGKVLVTEIDGVLTAGMITETEAYAGVNDKASHAYGGRRTSRTEVMYRAGGIAYVYLCYGIHHLFNVVTNTENVPHAVLVRAVEPLDGIADMLLRRGKDRVTLELTAGPGAMSAAFGIKTGHTGLSLQGGQIWIEDRNIQLHDSDIVAATRIGVAYAKEHALLPYRFYIANNRFVSRGKGL